MQFLADENFPFASITLLRQQGYVVHQLTAAQAGQSDFAVLSLANKLDAILLTFDSDFGNLIFLQNQKSAQGVIYFRLPQHQPTMPGELLLAYLAKQIPFAGRFSVLTQDGLRQRDLVGD